ncbi:potassium transporter Kup [Phenylobacterium sp.]|uniref:potassium transporter Kup n=1 Tax=Phenylobacterium sp. TaxID=1871053 RepID=UPI0035B33403
MSETQPGQDHKGFWGLTLASVGVVFGDIGTSPLYAMREALAHVRGGADEAAVLGVVSLVLWALIIIVTLKYLVLVMRADNRGEGGTLSLMALAQHALGRRSGPIFLLGVCGAALFYADGLITPAISVLSAAEGLVGAPGGAGFAPYVLPVATVILVALFAVQSRGTAAVGRYFGPITLVWFLTLGGLGLLHLLDAPQILQAFSPHWGLKLLFGHGLLGVAVLGSVFLVVTGAEALFADMGHFGAGPIRAGWLTVALPCLALNYLGQGALVLADPSAGENPFFRMIPPQIYWPVLGLTTAATVIASQAVITGAFSVTQQAVQLGLLPRLEVRRTSETMAGQIYVPVVNGALLAGVVFLLFAFRTSSAMASAYGIAITTTMVVTVALMVVIERRLWAWPLAAVIGVTAPLLLIDLVFLGANLLKILDGGWLPLVLAAVLTGLMWTWTKGSQNLAQKSRRDAVPLADLIASLSQRPPHRVAGTAFFLTADPTVAPVALMHNLKHNRVLHEKNVILSVRTADTPRVEEDQRLEVQDLAPGFRLVSLTFGFMETPNLPKALAKARREGLKFDIMSTSFFIGRRTVAPSGRQGMPLLQDRLFSWMVRNAENPTDYFHIPPGRVVELGTQVSV